MRTLWLAAASFLLVAPALAQNNNTNESNSGTAPENRGVTGWTGGSRDQKQETGNPEQDAREAANQPWMAEGADLKGAPRQFPPKKTVE
jgi:hypothetical protein